MGTVFTLHQNVVIELEAQSRPMSIVMNVGHVLTKGFKQSLFLLDLI